MQLKLYIPKTEQALQQKPETRPSVIADHLESLSGTDTEKAAQELVAELGRLNRAEIDEELRYKLSSLYDPVVQKLTEKLISSFPENGTPQSNTDRQVATLVYELALELTYAWKLSYLGLEQRISLFGVVKTKQNALNQLSNALSRLICTSYRTYTSPPSQSWQELHQVFSATRGENASATTADSVRLSSEGHYKRALLLALSNPFRFTRTEIQVMLAYLDKYHQLANLTTSNKSKNSVFCIDINSDTPYSQDIGPDMPPVLALDTHAICKQLRALIVKLKTGEPFRDLGLTEVPKGFDGLSFLSRLHQAWRGNAKRAFNRYVPELAHVEIICGIPAMHRLFDPKQKTISSATSQPTTKKSPSELLDQTLPSRWRILNDSASGLSISAHAQEVPQLRIGNPIALRVQGTNDGGWMLGVIRWGKMSKGQMVSAGVEKLAPTAASVVLRLLQGNFSNIGQPALLIPANPVLKIDEHLLLPQGLYKRGYHADMWHNGKSRRIALGSLVEQSPFFDLVELEPA